MKVRYLSGVCIVGIIASVALASSGVASEQVEALIARYQVSTAISQSRPMDQAMVQEAETPRLSVFSPGQLVTQTSWLALGGTNQPAAPAAAKEGGQGKPVHDGHSLAEINNKLNNPGANLAQLNFKFIWNQFEGDLPGSSSQDSLTLLFQPVIPFSLPDGGNLILRPTIPLVWQPSFNAGKGGFDENFGMGDSQLNVFYSRTNAKQGYMWGLGAVMQAPTHTDDSLGKDQFQMGPAGFAGIMGKWGSTGVFPQHLWNVCGSGEGYTATTFIQPWYWFSVGKGWQVGGSPIITYDWAADDSDEAWVVPVNLGAQKTILLGETPVKFRLEGIYYIEQPDAFGPHWGLQLTVTPVVKNVFGDMFVR